MNGVDGILPKKCGRGIRKAKPAAGRPITEENLHDCAYTFAVEGDNLTLVGGEGTVGGTYELHREAEVIFG